MLAGLWALAFDLEVFFDALIVFHYVPLFVNVSSLSIPVCIVKIV